MPQESSNIIQEKTVKIFDIARRRQIPSPTDKNAFQLYQSYVAMRQHPCAKFVNSLEKNFHEATEPMEYSFLTHLTRREFPILMPLIHLYIGGKMYRFLLDTGSSMCLLPQSILPADTPIQPVPFKITGVSGKAITPVGRANLVIDLVSNQKNKETIPCTMQACVFSQLPIQGADGIIGMDFLMHHGFSIDLSNKLLTRWNKEICKIENLDVPASTVFNLPTYAAIASDCVKIDDKKNSNNCDEIKKQRKEVVSILNCDITKNRNIMAYRHKLLSYQLPDRFRNLQVIVKEQEFAPGTYCVSGLHKVPDNGIIKIPISNYSGNAHQLPQWHQVQVSVLTDDDVVENMYDILKEAEFLKSLEIDKNQVPKPQQPNYTNADEANLDKSKLPDEVENKIIAACFAQPDLINTGQEPVDERFEQAIEKELPLTNLSTEGKNILKNTLRAYRDVINFKDEPLGHAAIFEQDIALNTNRVVRVPQFPLGQNQREPMATWVKQMLDYGIIRPSRSPYNSPCMMVPKPKGGWRMVIDFREINKYIAHDPYPLPDINRTLQELGRNGEQLMFLTSVDLLWGFYHISIQEGDRQKTAFTTILGRWEYIRLPMGMKTAPAAFQRLVDVVIMRNMLGNVFCYVDDVLCYSKTEKEHLLSLTRLFEILRQFGMKINMDKSVFARSEVAHLGHIVTATGIKMDETKLRKMRDLPTPKTPKQLKGLLGIASYYRRFVPDFAKIVRPLTNMLRKDTVISWGEKEANAREQLTRALETADSLDYIVQGSTKIITIGHDEHTLSAMLAQEREVDGRKIEKPIVFASKVLNPAEVRVKPEAKSLKAAKFAIQQFRPYLHACKVIIRTNDRILMQLQDKPIKELTTAQAKWITATLDICPIFELKTTKTNEAVNSLGDCWGRDITRTLGTAIQQEINKDSDNQMPCAFPADEMTIPDNLYKAHHADGDFDPCCAYIAPGFQYDFYKPILAGYEWVDLQNDDEQIRDLKERYDQGDPEVTAKYFKDLTDVLFRCFDQKKEMLVVVPKTLRKRTIQMYHDTPRSGHYAVRRTLRAIKANVWWEGMEKDVTDYIQKCLICQYYKLKGGKAPHMPRSIPPYPFYMISLDLVGPMTTTIRGNTFILVCQDAFSKWVEMIPLPDARVSTVADAFMTNVVVRYGPPMKILTDRGSQFTASLFAKMCAFLGVRSLLTTAYRPQCNGANERTHRELKRYLGMFMGIDDIDTELKVPWDILVRYAAWAYNTTYHSVLRMSPYEVLFNRAPSVTALGALGGEHHITERILRVFGNEEISDKNSRMSTDDREVLRLIALDRATAEQMQTKVAEYLEKAQQRWNKAPANVGEDGLCYRPGDQILLRNMRATSNTMLPKYTGPYEVLKQRSPVTYEIERPESYFKRTNGKDIVHIDRMKAFHDPDPGGPVKPLFLQPDDEIESEHISKSQLIEVTKAGLQSIMRLPPVAHKPVPTIAKHRINDLGQIEEDIEPLMVAAEEADLAAAGPEIEQIRITAAAPDTSPDPIQTHWEHDKPMTRSVAKVLKVKLQELNPFRRKWATS